MQQVRLLAIAAVVLVWLFERSDLDLSISRLFFDPAQGAFPLRREWVLEAVLHMGVRQAAFLLVAGSLCLCWFGWNGELKWLPPRNALLSGLGMLVIPAVISTLKLHSQRNCPWDIVEFGGYATYQQLFRAMPSGAQPGHCFPAGHAVSGYLWIVWAAALRPVGVRTVRICLWAALFAGTVLGLARVVQGAHFLSHVLWTLWLAWALSLILALIVGADLEMGDSGPSLRSWMRG